MLSTKTSSWSASAMSDPFELLYSKLKMSVSDQSKILDVQEGVMVVLSSITVMESSVIRVSNVARSARISTIYASSPSSFMEPWSRNEYVIDVEFQVRIHDDSLIVTFIKASVISVPLIIR